MKIWIGNFKGPKGDTGNTGSKGDKGDTGQRGSRWFSGTAVTGTSTTGAIFQDSGIADAVSGDYYINTDTGNLYQCTVSGAADTAEWVHEGNFKGPKGDTGPAGSISNINEQKPTYTEADKLENIESGETVKTVFGKLKKALSVLIAHYVQKATVSVLGHVKLSDSSAVTVSGEYALDAVEKNASVNGTLANQIASVNSNLGWKVYSRLDQIGLSYSLSNLQNITLSTIINALMSKGTYSEFCTNVYRMDFPNLELASASYRHIISIRYTTEWYVSIEDHDMDTGIKYVRSCRADGTYTEWINTIG